MRTSLVVFDHPPVRGLPQIVDLQEQMRVENLFAKRPVEALDVGFWFGFPGWMYRIAMPLSFAHCANASPRNSGPLSVPRLRGNPWSRLSCSKMRTSRNEVIDVSTSMCRASRLKSSTMLNVRMRRPHANASDMKSADHTVSGAEGTYSRARMRLGRRRRAARLR